MKRDSIVRIDGKLVLLSGTRVGGSQDELEIGGTDLPAIKHPVSGKPYVPGSSMKGRMRCELERETGRYGGPRKDEPCGCALPDCPICRVFGPHKNTHSQLGPTRIIVRDLPVLSAGVFEQKTENVINRSTGAAEHPRTMERVAAGESFHLAINLQVLDIDKDFTFASQRGADGLFEVVKEGLRLVQDTGLGSGVSRGSGHIRFEDLKRDGKPFNL